MTDRQFLVRRDRSSLYQAGSLRVRLAPKYRPKRTHQSPIGPITEIEEAGSNSRRLQVTILDALETTGRSAHPGSVVVDRTAAGVKAAVRRMRPEEAALVQKVDDEIESTKQRLADLRRERAELVRTAWSKAHVVRLQEVDPAGVPAVTI